MIDRKDFNITLLFPPVWLPETPYLSLPALSAYLEQGGYNPIQRDLNIEFWRHFYRPDQLKHIYEWSKEKYLRLKKNGESQPHKNNEGVDNEGITFMLDLRMMLLKESEYKKRILDFNDTPFPSRQEFIEKITAGNMEKPLFRKLCRRFWKETALKDNVMNIPSSQWESHVKYHDYFFTDISLSTYALSTAGIDGMLNDEKNNPFYGYLRRCALESILAGAPRLVGISVAAVNQVIPAFTLAKILKQYLPEAFIVLGGPWCTHLHDILPRKYSLFQWIDGVVFFEGEQAILTLAETLRQKKAVSTVPNLLYKKGSDMCRNPVVKNLDLNLLPAPGFNGLPLDKYEFANALPLQASRGCYWHRCVFCSYPVLDPVYRKRTPGRVVRDMEILIEKYGIKEFNFTDSVLEPLHIDEISKLIIKKGIKVKWRGFARFDRNLGGGILERMAAAGCKTLIWGLESGCPRILAMIRKGSSLSLIQKNLENAAKAGIENRAGVMYGFPTETLEEIEQTVRFLEKNVMNIHSVAYNFLSLERNTPIVKHGNNFSLKIKKNIECDLDIGYNHEAELAKEQLAEVEKGFEELAFWVARYHT